MRLQVSLRSLEQWVVVDHFSIHLLDFLITHRLWNKVSYLHHLHIKSRIPSVRKVLRPMSNTYSESAETTWKKCLLTILRRKETVITQDQEFIDMKRNLDHKDYLFLAPKNYRMTNRLLEEAKNFQDQVFMNMHVWLEWTWLNRTSLLRVSILLEKQMIDLLYQPEKFQHQHQTYTHHWTT